MQARLSSSHCTEFRRNQHEADPVKLRKMVSDAQQGLEALLSQSQLSERSQDVTYQLNAGNKFL
mgnify:CR=1 FL=1|jgi:hypothetical protein